MGTSNAVNLTDGLDGLAIGPVIISAFTFMILAYAAGTTLNDFNIAKYLRITAVDGAAEMTIFCAAIIGGGIGFLWYNAYPALVFMGDVGALALGGALGLLAIFTKNEVLSAVLHGVFLAEAISVILQVASFKMTGNRIFKMAPVHHHFELKGWPEPRVIVRFWIVKRDARFIGVGIVKVEIEVIVVFAYEYTKKRTCRCYRRWACWLGWRGVVTRHGARPFLVDDAPKAASKSACTAIPMTSISQFTGAALKKIILMIFLWPFISWRAANACGARTVVETRCTKII